VKAKVALRETFGDLLRSSPRSVGLSMKHSVTISLNRQEEDTLRLIAHGISSSCRSSVPRDHQPGLRLI
jgi:hypothetical protein